MEQISCYIFILRPVAYCILKNINGVFVITYAITTLFCSVHIVPLRHAFLLLLVIDVEVVIYKGVIREKPASKEEARQFMKGLYI